MQVEKVVSLSIVNTDEIDLAESRCSHKILHFITTYILFFFNIDPFAIYKDVRENQLSRYRIHQLPQFQLKRGRFDLWRERWRKVFVLWIVYFVSKCIIILMNQFILYNTDNKLYTYDSRYDETSWTSFAIYSNHLVGNPLSTRIGLSISLCTYLALSLTHNFIWHIRFYLINLLDSVYLRIFLKPELEFKRIDFVINEKLIDLRLLMFDYEKIHQNQFYLIQARKVGDFSEIEGIINSLYKRVKLMRPIFYNKEMLNHLYSAAIKAVILVACLAIPWPFLLARSLHYGIMKSRCSIKKIELENCSSSDILTWRDDLTFIELVVAITLQGTFMTLEILIILANIYTQIKSAEDIYKQMSNLLRWLKIENRFYLDSMHSDANAGKQLAHKHSNHIPEDQVYDSLSVIEQMLLEMLIKIRVTEDDIIRNNQFISQASTTFLSIISTGLVLILVSGKLQESELNNLRIHFFLWLLTVGNMTALGCAFAYARLVRLEKSLFCPLLAQILIKDQLPKQRYWFRVIAVSWVKLIRSSRISDPMSSVRFFNVTLTYEKIISMNFVLISIGAILKSL